MMDCTQAQKVRYGTHMLAAEADDWWLETRQRLENAYEDITWAVFRRDVRGKKEIEFLKLKQGNMSVTEYAAKFTELAKFYPHYDGEGVEFSKCIKFENGLRYEVRKAIGYQKIRVFSDLVDSCSIFEEDNNAHYKVVASLMMLRLVKETRRLGVRSLVGETLLPRLNVSSVARLVTRAMHALLM